MISKWNIDDVVAKMTTNTEQQSKLKTELMKALEEEKNHEMAFKDAKKSSGKFTRYTKFTEEIYNNFKEMKSMQIAAAGTLFIYTN